MYRYIVIFFLFPFVGHSQFHLQKIELATKFADGGDYEPINKYLIYVGISDNMNTATMEGISLCLKNMETDEESTIVPDIYLSDPYYGWLDEANLYYEKKVSTDENEFFGSWKSQLIKYNVYTHKETILPFDLLNSENRLSHIKVRGNKIYFLNKDRNSGKNILEEYNIETRERKLIKTFEKSTHQQMVSFEVIDNRNSIIYIVKEENKTDFIEIDLMTKKETIIKSIKAATFIDGSTSIGSFLYYFERKINSNKIETFENPVYVINSLNINSGEVECIKSFNAGTEITKIDMVSFDEMIISMQSGEADSINIAINEDINIRLSSNSNLFLFKF